MGLGFQPVQHCVRFSIERPDIYRMLIEQAAKALKSNTANFYSAIALGYRQLREMSSKIKLEFNVIKVFQPSDK